MHQVCLVSDQLVPNFLPVQDPGLKPKRLTMAVSERMRPKAENLRELVRVRNIEVCGDIPIPYPMNIRSCRDIFAKWMELHLYEDVVLNVTGGTKPMAIAAQEVFRLAKKPVFYVDINTDRVSWLGESGNKPVALDGASISLKDILALYGFSIEEGAFQSSVKDGKWMALAEKLTDPVWTKAVGALNRVVMRGMKGKTLDCTGFIKETSDSRNRLLGDLLKELYKSNLTTGGDTLEFRSVEARSFCIGAWLEHLAFAWLKELGFTDKQLLMNLKIKDGNGNMNELDCAVTHRNRLYVVECKTRSMKMKSIADQTIYKLDKLAKLGGGLRAQGVLVSCRRIHQKDRDRAKAYGVLIFDNPATLKEKLQGIFGKKKEPAAGQAPARITDYKSPARKTQKPRAEETVRKDAKTQKPRAEETLRKDAKAKSAPQRLTPRRAAQPPSRAGASARRTGVTAKPAKKAKSPGGTRPAAAPKDGG